MPLNKQRYAKQSLSLRACLALEGEEGSLCVCVPQGLPGKCILGGSQSVGQPEEKAAVFYVAILWWHGAVTM